MSARRNGLLIALEVLTPLVLIGLYAWWAGPRDSFFFPPLQRILSTFWMNWLGERLASDIWPSLYRAMAGFGLAVVLGVTAGLLLGLSRWARLATAPLVDFLRALPPPALLPLTILVLGVGDTAKIMLIALVCLFPILMNTIAGVAGLDPTLKETARVYGIGRKDQLLYVIVPAASPSIFAGLRTSLSLAIIMMVISEFVAAADGIGFGIWKAKRLFNIPEMWAGIVLLGILGYALNMILIGIERVVLHWHRGARAGAR
jgi:ABC-type nitrate/sulfonate/bicarbonate transport system permease component